ncbi:hypothetical protein [Mesorhizobium sp. L-8-10]|nr:hypothetical protein [Mesorhizobium sp. L-8-10]
MRVVLAILAPLCASGPAAAAERIVYLTFDDRPGPAHPSSST